MAAPEECAALPVVLLDAGPRLRDLLLCAKYLFVAAIVVAAARNHRLNCRSLTGAPRAVVRKVRCSFVPTGVL